MAESNSGYATKEEQETHDASAGAQQAVDYAREPHSGHGVTESGNRKQDLM